MLMALLPASWVWPADGEVDELRVVLGEGDVDSALAFTLGPELP